MLDHDLWSKLGVTFIVLLGGSGLYVPGTQCIFAVLRGEIDGIDIGGVFFFLIYIYREVLHMYVGCFTFWARYF